MAKKMKRLKCPYCEYRSDRESMIQHIADEHEEMIPEGCTPRRVVFNAINNKTHGSCVICGKETEWIEEAGHYDRYCSDECREKAREMYLKNISKVKKTTNLMADPEFQKKLLAGRRISGEYRFKDGGVRSYTGSYEKKLLEFADKCLNIHSKYIMTPGPTLEYSYNGEKHKWIIDQFWEPWNLLIEVKDGGDKPNTREMPEYRTKQLCKEVMITDRGDYNYLRLTNNQFPQLIEILMEIKKENMDGIDTAIIKIYENGPITEMTHNIVEPKNDPNTQHGVYFIKGNMIDASTGKNPYALDPNIGVDPRAQHGVFFISYSFSSYVDDESIEGFALANDLIPDNILRIKDGKIVKESADFLKDRKITVFKYLGESTLKDIYTKDYVDENYFYEALTGKKMFTKEQAVLDYENFSIIRPDIYSAMKSCYEATFRHDFGSIALTNFYFPMMSESALLMESVMCDNTICFREDMDGIFVYNTNLDQRSKSYKDIESIPRGVLECVKNFDIRRFYRYDCTDILSSNVSR